MVTGNQTTGGPIGGLADPALKLDLHDQKVTKLDQSEVVVACISEGRKNPHKIPRSQIRNRA